MSSDIRVFLISPAKVVVYSLDGPNPDVRYIYNAGSLELIPNPRILSFTEISGSVTPAFGVKPLILGYTNGLFEVLYAPLNLPCLFRSDGTLARHDGSPVNLKGVLEIPNLKVGPVGSRLIPLELAPPNDESIQRYIQMSHQGVEYETDQCYQEAARPPDPPKPISVAPSDTPAAAQPTPRGINRSPSPRLARPPGDAPPRTDGTLEEQLKLCQQEIEDLKRAVEVFMRRHYKIYPIEMPSQFRVGKTMVPVIPLEELQKRMANGELERFEFNPLYQAFAGSYSSNDRLLTYYSKNGEIFHVRVNYDPQTNEINPPGHKRTQPK